MYLHYSYLLNIFIKKINLKGHVKYIPLFNVHLLVGTTYSRIQEVLSSIFKWNNRVFFIGSSLSSRPYTTLF